MQTQLYTWAKKEARSRCKCKATLRVYEATPEDSAADTIRPRLEAVGGDPTQVLLLNTVECFDEKRMGMFDYPFSLSRDLQDLEMTIQRRKVKQVTIGVLALLESSVLLVWD